MTGTSGRVLAALVAAASVTAAGVVEAADKELNLYSSRHYQTDEALYANFEEATGIKINRIEGKGDALIERIRSEGANSPADVLLTVDAGRLWRADDADLFQEVDSTVLRSRVPENLQDPDGKWFGFSTRARLIYYDPEKVDPADIATYESLADPKLRGMVCARTGSNIYNLSLMSSIIDAHGEEAAEDWAKGVVANFARPPQGGDTDQIRAVAAGECAIAIANSYYFVRLATSDKAEDKEVVEKVRWVFPNQDDRGTHVNVSGAGVLKNAPNREAAVMFLEYLAGEEAQSYFANGNNEYPVVAGVDAKAPVMELGSFQIDPINVAVYGQNQADSQKVMDRAGWN